MVLKESLSDDFQQQLVLREESLGNVIATRERDICRIAKVSFYYVFRFSVCCAVVRISLHDDIRTPLHVRNGRIWRKSEPVRAHGACRS